MNELYVCPFCHKRKAWASSTYPLIVVHNCQGSLLEVGSLNLRLEILKNGRIVKHKEFHPINGPVINLGIKILEVRNVEDLKQCFINLELNKVSYFTGQHHYKNFPFWEKLWEYKSYKVVNNHNVLLYLVLLDHDFQFRSNATACMGFRGTKPSHQEAKSIFEAFKKDKIPVKDEALSIRYITKEFEH